MSTSLRRQGFPSIEIKPFPIGQGEPLPDATQAHLAPLWLISQEGQLVGFGTVLFLVSNTGADILIANNILDFLGILRYRPPLGYEATLETEAKRLYIPIGKRAPPWEIVPEVLESMLHYGQCLITESKKIEGLPLLPFEISIDQSKLGGFRPIATSSRRISSEITQQVNRQLAELVEEGIIQPNFTSANEAARRPRSRSPLSPEREPIVVSMVTNTKREHAKESEEQGCKPPHKYRYDDDNHLNEGLVVTTDASLVGSASIIETRSQFENRKRGQLNPASALNTKRTSTEFVRFSLTLCEKCGKHQERCICETLLPNNLTHGQLASKQKEPVKEEKEESNREHTTPAPPALTTPAQLTLGKEVIKRQEIRRQKIQEAKDLTVGKDPPLKPEITEALNLLKRIAESSVEQICTTKEVQDLQEELAKGRPKWAKCLTPANVQASQEVQWAKNQIEEMMDGRFKDTVFGKTLAIPCSFEPFQIKTKTGSAPERAVQPRRFKDPKVTQLIDEWVEGLLKDGLIEESYTPVAAPVTVVMKKGRDPRVCIDYRERNARTDTPVYPMPDIHDFLDEAAGHQFYCSFDCTKMFNQYEIVKEHRHLAAFMTQRGTYEPKRIMFGVTGGPQHAVRSARPALKSHSKTNGIDFTKWAKEQNEKGETPPYSINPTTGVVPGSRLDIFVDDCRMGLDNLKGLVKLSELWFEFCEEHHLVLSRKKAKLALTHLQFLGFVVSKEGKHLDPSRISNLLDIPTPTSREGLHALLCCYNFVRVFIPEFSVLASPLYAATRGIVWKGPGSGRSKGTREIDPEFRWTEVLDRSLRQLQAALLEAPILLCPDYSKALFLSVDACLKGEGWVLWQIVVGTNGSLIPVAIHYGSTKYDDSESTWEVTRQEAHAIQSALKDVYDYIFFCHFYLLTDHRNLTFLSQSVNRAVIRIRHFMQQFNMTVVHVPGAWNNPADGISRLDVEHLPVEIASDLTSATTVQALEDFLVTHRGTNPGLLNLEEGDRIVEVKVTNASALYTTAILPQQGCPFEKCLLCQPCQMSEEDASDGAQCFFSSSSELTNDSDSECSEEDEPLDWEREQDLVEHVHLKSHDSRVLLTRAQARKEAEEWNRQQVEKKHNSKGDNRNKPSEESEWISKENERRSIKILSVSREWTPFESVLEAPKLQTAEKKSGRCQETQTTPADFRTVRIQSPLIEDFKAIHSDEEGHHGIDHSYRKLMVRCGSSWAEEKETATNVRNDLKIFIKNCPTCQKVRGLQDKVKSKHSFIISRPFIEVSYDFICFDKPDRYGNRYILVVVDNFTKLVEMKAVPDRGAEGVARFLLELKARYGPINRLRSDQEKAFTSQIVSKLNELTGTTTLPCIAYHPEANSVCERQNQIIMHHLRALVMGAKLGPNSAYAWSELLPFVYSIVNNTPKLPLAISPLSMVYGIFANYDQPLLSPRAPEGHSNPVDYVEGLVEWQNKLLELAEGIQSKYLERLVHAQAFKEDQPVKRTFQEGDFVLQLKTSTGAVGKLLPRWLGPKLVLARQDNDPSHPMLFLYDLVSSKTKQASIDDCRLFHTGWFDEPTMLQDLNRLAALDKEEYEVETILEHRPPGPQRGSKIKPSAYWFKVKWAGFSDEENSWEPYSELKNLLPLEEYLRQYPELKL